MPEQVLLADDHSINDDGILLRQVKPTPVRQNPGIDYANAGMDGGPRIRGGAFQLASPEVVSRFGYSRPTMSFYLQHSVLERHESVDAWADQARPTWGLIVVGVREARESGVLLAQDHLGQLDDDELGVENLSRDLAFGHAVLWVPDRADGSVVHNLPGGKQKALVRAASARGWIRLPDPQDPDVDPITRLLLSDP